MTELHNKTVFNEQIRPLMNELVRLCGRYKIPCFMTFAVDNTEEKTTYINNGVMTKSRRIELADDKIKDHMLIANGFTAKPKFDAIDAYVDTEVARLKKLTAFYKKALAEEGNSARAYKRLRKINKHVEHVPVIEETTPQPKEKTLTAHYEKYKDYQHTYKQEYYQEHKEEIIARNKEYYKANRERIIARMKAYNQANRDKILARQQAYRERKKNEDNGE